MQVFCDGYCVKCPITGIFDETQLLQRTEDNLRSVLLDKRLFSDAATAASLFAHSTDISGYMYAYSALNMNVLRLVLPAHDTSSFIGVALGSPFDPDNTSQRFISLLQPNYLILPVQVAMHCQLHAAILPPTHSLADVQHRAISPMRLAELIFTSRRHNPGIRTAVDALEALRLLAAPEADIESDDEDLQLPAQAKKPTTTDGTGQGPGHNGGAGKGSKTSSTTATTRPANSEGTDFRAVLWDAAGQTFQYQRMDYAMHYFRTGKHPMEGHISSEEVQRHITYFKRYLRYKSTNDTLLRVHPTRALLTVPRRRDIHTIIHETHLELMHAGETAVRTAIESEYYIRGLSDLVHDYAAKCPRCLLMRQACIMHNRGAYFTSRPLERVFVDLTFVTKIVHDTSVYDVLLVIVDHFSSYTWIRPLKGKTAEPIANLLVECLEDATKELFRAHGGAARFPIMFVHSDNGTEFLAEAFRRAIEMLNAKEMHGMPYQPQMQGKVERMNKEIKHIMCQLFTRFPAVYAHPRWDLVLPYVEAIINTKGRESFAIKTQRKGFRELQRIVISAHLLLRGFVVNNVTKTTFRALPPQHMRTFDELARAKDDALLSPADTAHLDSVEATDLGMPELVLEAGLSLLDDEWMKVVQLYGEKQAENARVRMDNNFKNERKKMKQRKGYRVVQPVQEDCLAVVAIERSRRLQIKRRFLEWLPTYVAVVRVHKLFTDSALVMPLQCKKEAPLMQREGDNLYRVKLHNLQRFDPPKQPPKSYLLSSDVSGQAMLVRAYQNKDLTNPFIQELAAILQYNPVVEVEPEIVVPAGTAQDDSRRSAPTSGLAAASTREAQAARLEADRRRKAAEEAAMRAVRPAKRKASQATRRSATKRRRHATPPRTPGRKTMGERMATADAAQEQKLRRLVAKQQRAQGRASPGGHKLRYLSVPSPSKSAAASPAKSAAVHTPLQEHGVGAAGKGRRLRLAFEEASTASSKTDEEVRALLGESALSAVSPVDGPVRQDTSAAMQLSRAAVPVLQPDEQWRVAAGISILHQAPTRPPSRHPGITGFKWADNQCHVDCIVFALHAAKTCSPQCAEELDASLLPSGVLQHLVWLVDLMERKQAASSSQYGHIARKKKAISRAMFTASKASHWTYGTHQSYLGCIDQLLDVKDTNSAEYRHLRNLVGCPPPASRIVCTGDTSHDRDTTSRVRRWATSVQPQQLLLCGHVCTHLGLQPAHQVPETGHARLVQCRVVRLHRAPHVPAGEESTQDRGPRLQRPGPGQLGQLCEPLHNLLRLLRPPL